MRVFQQTGRRGERGISLLEVLIATVLLSILATQVAAFMARGRVAILEEGRKRTAIHLAQTELEKFESLPTALMTSSSRTVTSGSWSYTVQTTVTPATPVADMNSVTVRVNWRTHRGASRSVQMEAAYNEPR